MIDLIGAPYDLGAQEYGTRLAPAALRLEQIGKSISDLKIPMRDCGDIAVALQEFNPLGLNSFESGYPVYQNLKAEVGASLRGGSVPLIVGGDHSVSIGSVAAALDHYEDLNVIWIDAHADCNRPDTSPTGNLHGMPLAALVGQETTQTDVAGEQWRRLLSDLVPRRRLHRNRIAWIGLRDVDAGEDEFIQGCPGAFVATMQDIDRFGMGQVVRGLLDWLKEGRSGPVWVSFDVDSLDPALAPGTGTVVRGGLTYREAHLLAELLCEGFARLERPIAGIEIVEVNPILDTKNGTARAAIEWLSSLLGKRIMSRHPSAARLFREVDFV